MNTYLTTMFWLGILSVVKRSFFLVGNHPRKQITNIGSEVLGWLSAAGFLAWVCYLKFWSVEL